MKRKLAFGLICILALSTGFTGVLAKGEVDVSNGDKIRVVTVEEQEARENKAIEGNAIKTVITAKEQKSVESSSALSGVVTQKNGKEFYFIKEK
ncbi:hypothetical protein GLV94_01370 [Virgibacillus halodenitrificans]|uniref:hypothetical protein n=1 Tax=Virgibacillus halodenitrificans TaxID=1482 RepID=UPI0013718FA7|nr:hypothetical protein [Virgibacillus halodenitrificans]MYL44285.1 hypothetical protein [Virgibacillus halodenitrificans]